MTRRRRSFPRSSPRGARGRRRRRSTLGRRGHRAGPIAGLESRPAPWATRRCRALEALRAREVVAGDPVILPPEVGPMEASSSRVSAWMSRTRSSRKAVARASTRWSSSSGTPPSRWGRVRARPACSRRNASAAARRASRSPTPSRRPRGPRGRPSSSATLAGCPPHPAEGDDDPRPACRRPGPTFMWAGDWRRPTTTSHPRKRSRRSGTVRGDRRQHARQVPRAAARKRSICWSGCTRTDSQICASAGSATA